MNEIKVNLENLKDDEREQLLALIEKANKKPKRLKPNKDNIYWFVNSCGGTMYNSCYSPQTDLERYDLNNCFATKEEAEFEAEKRKVVAELEIFAIENNDKIDWLDDNQCKYFLYYDYTADTFEVDWCWHRNQGDIYFSSEELCKQAIEKVGADRIKKYLFEVEEV